MIIKKKHDNNFTTIPNAIIEDKTLSPEARWTLIYLLSKPKDWVVRVTDIRNFSGFGRDKSYQMLRELCEAGYIEKVQQRQEDGSFGEIEYLVKDSPHTEIQEPFPDLQNPVNTEPSKDLVIPNTEYLLAKANRTQSVNEQKDFSEARNRLWKMIPNISSETGVPERRLRPIVGKWLKTLDDEAALLCKIIDEAADHDPADFISFVTATVNAKSKKGAGAAKSWLELWKE